jgi:hypothetical protein
MEAKAHILIVDDDTHSATLCPDAVVDQFYADITPSQYGAVSQIDLTAIPESENYSKLAASNLINKKLLIWHGDGGSLAFEMTNELDALSIYLENGGKLIVSGGTNLVSLLQNIYDRQPAFFTQFFDSPDLLSQVHMANNGTTLNHPWFISAVSEAAGYNDIPLNLTSSHVNAVNTTMHGWGLVSYFDNPGVGTAFYKFGCKAVGNGPTTEDYNLLTSKHVAVRFDHGNSSVAIFGFPVSLMEQAPAQQMLHTLCSSMMQNSKLAYKGAK